METEDGRPRLIRPRGPIHSGSASDAMASDRSGSSFTGRPVQSCRSGDGPLGLAAEGKRFPGSGRISAGSLRSASL